MRIAVDEFSFLLSTGGGGSPSLLHVLVPIFELMTRLSEHQRGYRRNHNGPSIRRLSSLCGTQVDTHAHNVFESHACGSSRSESDLLWPHRARAPLGYI